MLKRYVKPRVLNQMLAAITQITSWGSNLCQINCYPNYSALTFKNVQVKPHQCLLWSVLSLFDISHCFDRQGIFRDIGLQVCLFTRSYLTVTAEGFCCWLWVSFCSVSGNCLYTDWPPTHKEGRAADNGPLSKRAKASLRHICASEVHVKNFAMEFNMRALQFTLFFGQHPVR